MADGEDLRGFLRQRVRPAGAATGALVSCADLYSGCGGLTLGFWEAARRAGLQLEVRLAVERDADAARAFGRNFPEAQLRLEAVERVFPGRLGAPLGAATRALAASTGTVDLLLAGPPCQGHSDLNNKTRRDDPKNKLYLRVVRAAEVLAPSAVIIENVPAVRHDKGRVTQVARRWLEEMGYDVADGLVWLDAMGAPQARRRHLLVALAPQVASSLGGSERLLADYATRTPRPRTVEDAIGDLQHRIGPGLDRPAVASEANRRRMRWLDDHQLRTLPNAHRPACHRDRDHTYASAYGRLRWDRPAPTITSGFGSLGQGRFMHPSQRRMLTPHEAARLQGFPDWFEFGGPELSRAAMAQMIGNAVPPMLGTAIGARLLPVLADGRRGAVEMELQRLAVAVRAHLHQVEVTRPSLMRRVLPRRSRQHAAAMTRHDASAGRAETG